MYQPLRLGLFRLGDVESFGTLAPSKRPRAAASSLVVFKLANHVPHASMKSDLFSIITTFTSSLPPVSLGPFAISSIAAYGQGLETHNLMFERLIINHLLASIRLPLAKPDAGTP